MTCRELRSSAPLVEEDRSRKKKCKNKQTGAEEQGAADTWRKRKEKRKARKSTDWAWDTDAENLMHTSTMVLQFWFLIESQR